MKCRFGASGQKAPLDTMDTERQALEALVGLKPTCPKCGSENGYLGTSNAYFYCHECKDAKFWCDGLHTGGEHDTWAVCVAASPWKNYRGH